MKKIINTAIVGFGLSGKVFHAPFIHLHDGFHLTKVVERHSENAKSIYEHIETIKDFNDLLKDDLLDLVVISTPNIYHFSMAKACLEAGKHIVIEKPFMPTSAEADEIIELAYSKKLKVFVYQNRRWDGDFLSIKKLIEGDTLGDIYYFESHFDRFSPVRTRAAWRDEDLPGSGILFDLGSHLIDQVYSIFGLPISINADIQSQREGSKVDDFFKIQLNYPNVKVVVTAGMLVEKPELRYIIKGAKGTYIKNGFDPQEEELKQDKLPEGKGWGKETVENWGSITFDNSELLQEKLVESEAGDYMAFYHNVYDVIVNHAEMAIHPEEARDVIRIIELAFESNTAKMGNNFNQ